MPPADPPPPAPDSPAEVPAAPAASAARRRRPAADSGGRKPSVATEWITTREEPLECAACGAPFVLSYKYRFVEGLAANTVRCPAAACRQGREYYLPVNAFDVLVTAATAGPPRP